MKTRALFRMFVLAGAAILAPAGCFISFPDYGLPPSAHDGGVAGSGGAVGSGGATASANGGAIGTNGGTDSGSVGTADAGPTCTDGIANGHESDVDCGGDVCLGCKNGQACAAPSDCAIQSCTAAICQDTLCVNGTVDKGESDIDCGGTRCPGCAPAHACTWRKAR